MSIIWLRTCIVPPNYGGAMAPLRIKSTIMSKETSVGESGWALLLMGVYPSKFSPPCLRKAEQTTWTSPAAMLIPMQLSKFPEVTYIWPDVRLECFSSALSHSLGDQIAICLIVIIHQICICPIIQSSKRSFVRTRLIGVCGYINDENLDATVRVWIHLRYLWGSVRRTSRRRIFGMIPVLYV